MGALVKILIVPFDSSIPPESELTSQLTGGRTLAYAHLAQHLTFSWMSREVRERNNRSQRNRIRKSKLFHWIQALRVAFAIFLLAGSAAPAPAQLPTSTAPPTPKTEPTRPTDPLGRDTPHSAIMGFLKYEQRGDYATAALYLQSPPDQNEDLVQRAKELQALRGKFNGSIGLLSDDPNGPVEPGLPPGQVRAGVFAVDGTTVDVIIVRVDDPTSGKIWLISKDTVASIPKLYAQMQSETPAAVDRLIPGALTSRQFLGMPLAKWLGWLLSIPISWLLAWPFVFLLSVPARVRCRLRKLPFTPVWETRVGAPFKYIVAISMHSVFVYLLGPPLFYRAHYFRFMATLLMGCFAWLVSTITDQGFEHAVDRRQMQRGGGQSVLIMMQRLTHILLLTIALVAALAMFGFNVKATLAGLGIGGLAIALAAQKTLENLIGGVSLLMDKAVQVGDLCRIGDQLGTGGRYRAAFTEATNYRSESAARSERFAGANAVREHEVPQQIAYQPAVLVAN